ncbi:Argininosuccinate lyase [Cordyceps fumosorosea ARSEF 2679]|uniref:Arginosuccinase n=1 Tax=Cordyceps fumosorosea (strain ARSEF 2679) TaxID=1081104 RepID=A0A167TIN6_CORFA|nr:Argininosuccinate lyase [Cordyceps fumosorosea ARSEF 2679]OAA60637.1 Argininosuccinate lyase [Cordyceps fumosorosea ARSEF 2679]
MNSNSTPFQVYHSWPSQKSECKQFDDFCWIDLAHVVMLVEQKTVDRAVGQKLLPALQEIRAQGYNRLPIDPFKESLLYQVESALGQKLGDHVAGALHTARSRIDQRATVSRMYYRRMLLQVMDHICQFQERIVEAAQEHASQIIPYHTHMQQAQPGNFAHYLLSFAAKLQEDFERCQEAYARVNRSPLGTVGRSGTGLRIDRERTARLLGFDGCVRHSLLGKDADFAGDVLAALSFVMCHLNDFATDLHLWSSNEFGFVRLPDAFCGTSSVFPQKRNPVTLEAIKLAAGPSVAWLTSALATFRGAGTGDHRARGVPAHLDHALETTADMLALAGLVAAAVRVDEERVAEVLAASWSTTSNLADFLMQHRGLSIRQAHGVVARLVRACREEGLERVQVTPAMLEEASLVSLGEPVQVSEEELHEALDPESFVKTRTSAGSVGPAEVEGLTELAQDMLSDNRRWVMECRSKHLRAETMLTEAISAVLKD